MAEIYPGLETLERTHDESRQGEVYASTKLVSDKSARKYFIESYGCAMNFSDSEIVASILAKENFVSTQNFFEADLILINTCSIREKAELTIRKRLTEFRKAKKIKPETLIGVLGCMAERLKSKLLEEEKLVDLVVGPDAYRDLPNLISNADEGQKSVNVLLSREETYADISPVRLNSNGITAFISIMRGCDNMCSFCVVPFTRGRERSRDAHSIIEEAKNLFNEGYKEVTLLGQNVDSYKWKDLSAETSSTAEASAKEVVKEEEKNTTVNFAQLLEMVAQVSPQLRVRFSTSHPKDITDEVLFTIAKYKNICDYIHLPIQSGSTRLLEKMNRTYTRDWYLERVASIRKIIPGCTISTDIISGFCSETEVDHADTLSIMKEVKYELAYMYIYSERPGTLAERNYDDDVPEEVKSRRLSEIVAQQRLIQEEKNKNEIGNIYEVLAEGISKRSTEQLFGRNSHNKVIVFPKKNIQTGNYVNVKVTDYTSGTLIGEIVSE